MNPSGPPRMTTFRRVFLNSGMRIFREKLLWSFLHREAFRIILRTLCLAPLTGRCWFIPCTIHFPHARLFIFDFNHSFYRHTYHGL